MGTSLDIGDGEDRQELVAEVRVVDDAAEAAGLIEGLATLDVAAAWEGEPGGPRSAGWRS